MVNCIININCRHLWDVFLLISVTYVTFYTKLQIMTLKIAYKNESCFPTPGRKVWLLFSVRDMSWGLRTHAFLSFLWSVVCKRPVINVPLITINYLQKDKTNMIYSNRINEIIWALHISARHIYQLQTSVIWTSALKNYVCYVFYEIADNNLKDCISE